MRSRSRSWKTALVASNALQLVLPALVIGAASGLAAVGFRWLITFATLLFTGRADYSAVAGHPANPWVPWLGGAFVVIAPVVGGLIYGPLIERFAKEARGHGVPEVMYAVNRRGGRINGSVAVVKALASAICIGSGGSVGREGPIVQIGSALGSTLGRLMRMPESRVRTLVACGAAGGIAATFNAPIAGVFFALELLLRDFAATSFAAVVLSSVMASVVGRFFLGNHPFLRLPGFSVQSPIEYGLFALLGIVAALVGVGFTKALYAIEDLCDWLWRGPAWLRPAVGGLLLGSLLLALPQLYGVGYPVLKSGASGKYVLWFVLILLAGKVLATSLTIGIGGSGGVFAPSLFIGAMCGAGFGEIAGAVNPVLHSQIGTFALVGMGAVLAGATRAPVTATIILFELTDDYGVILPLLLAVAVAIGISRLLTRETIYTMKLARRGVRLGTRMGASALTHTSIASVMSPPPPALPATLFAAEAFRRIADSSAAVMPVTSSGGVFVGLVTAAGAAEALSDDDDLVDLPLLAVTQEAATVLPEQPLSDAVALVVGETGREGVPVVDGERVLRGWLRPEAVLRALSAEHPT